MRRLREIFSPEAKASGLVIGSRAWMGLLAASVAILVVADAVLLEATSGFFTAGYNGVVLTTGGEIARFAFGSAMLDLFFVLAFWTLALPALFLLGLSRARVFAIAGLATIAGPLWYDVIRYKVHTILGDLLPLDVLWELAGGSVGAMTAEALPELDTLVVTVLGILATGVIAIVVLTQIERRVANPEATFSPPRVRVIAVAALLAFFAAPLLLAGRSTAATRVRAGLERKPSAILADRLVLFATDFDRDGFGWLSRPADPAPWDADIHPFARDQPGNHVDENGLEGDHPTDYERLRPIGAKGFAGSARPHLLFVYLESFRADLLGRSLSGQEITPFLNELARRGVASQRAYVHSPYTARSRAQLFTGRLDPKPGDPSLIDDFRGRGYATAWFSGQDDSFGTSESLIGADRVDHFYDARQDLSLRTSRSKQPVSLQVSWRTLLERIAMHLDHRAGQDDRRPLFLYANVVDSHYPYHHDGLDTLLDVDPVDRSGIRVRNAEAVWRTYLNAAANVDRAVADLVALFEAHVGDDDHAIVVTADHAQAFYEQGFLGHGRSLDAYQTRVPLILVGIGGDWPEPIGAADLRGLLLENLGVEREAPRARLRPDPVRRIFQYFPTLDRPQRAALRGLEGALVYDFPTGRASRLSPEESGPAGTSAGGSSAAELRDLVLTWEALRLEQTP